MYRTCTFQGFFPPCPDLLILIFFYCQLFAPYSSFLSPFCPLSLGLLIFSQNLERTCWAESHGDELNQKEKKESDVYTISDTYRYAAQFFIASIHLISNIDNHILYKNIRLKISCNFPSSIHFWFGFDLVNLIWNC